MTAYQVLSPWAEVDPVPLQGTAPRLSTLSGKKIGLFVNNKLAAEPILQVVENDLQRRFSDVTFTRFRRDENIEVADTEDKAEYEKWLKEVDGVVFAVGD